MHHSEDVTVGLYHPNLRLCLKMHFSEWGGGYKEHKWGLYCAMEKKSHMVRWVILPFVLHEQTCTRVTPAKWRVRAQALVPEARLPCRGAAHCGPKPWESQHTVVSSVLLHTWTCSSIIVRWFCIFLFTENAVSFFILKYLLSWKYRVHT